MGELVHVAAAVSDDMLWHAHVLGSNSVILSLTYSNCLLDRLGGLSFPSTGLPVAFLLRQIFVVGVGVNGCDVSLLECVGALELTLLKPPEITINFPKFLNPCKSAPHRSSLRSAKRKPVALWMARTPSVTTSSNSLLVESFCKAFTAVEINRILFKIKYSKCFINFHTFLLF